MLGPPGTLRNIVRGLLTRDRSLARTLHMRVRPGQIDFNNHMNQSCYAQVLELGRADWILGTRAYMHWRSQGYNPVVAEQTITYRRELKLLQAYRIDTRVVGMDGRLMVFEQHILVGGRVHAKAVVKLIFVGPDGVETAQKTEALVRSHFSEPLQVSDWRAV